ncbi:MAG: hypothetical protein H6738_14535 [Alphaproteobacteria bacterium]|nr:hypothetical protein [Alphaproteobacteria bacterium]
MELVVREGRDFLQHDDRRYDLVHVANNGAVQAGRTGHTRRFLDTREAMAAYLDRLAPGGLLVFADQPIAEKLGSFATLFAERGLGPLEEAVAVYGRPRNPSLRTLVVVPGGLTEADRAAVRAEARDAHLPVLYLPGDGDLASLSVNRPVTDDRPFTRGLELGALDLHPAAHQGDLGWISSWVKVLTVLLFAALSAVAGAALLLAGRREARVPARWVAYLGATGLGYMGVEIGLIARTELFVGNPLYAVAVDLAVFLVASALGSWSSSRPLPLGRLGLALATTAAVAWGLVSTAWLGDHALGAPLAAKLLLVPAAIGPAGVALGRYYPAAVAGLEAQGRAAAVPATYALTTLWSVLGSVFAATAMIEAGFRAVVLAGAAAYLIACALLPEARERA